MKAVYIEDHELLIQYKIISMIYTISEVCIFTTGTKTTVSV